MRQSPVLKIAQFIRYAWRFRTARLARQDLIPGMVADASAGLRYILPYMATVETGESRDRYRQWNVLGAASPSTTIYPSGLPCTVHFHTPWQERLPPNSLRSLEADISTSDAIETLLAR